MTTTAPDPIPGEHLAEILDELGISQYRLAKDHRGAPDTYQRNRPLPQINHSGYGAANWTGPLGMTPEFWLNLQRMYDLNRARASTDISTIEPLVECIHPPLNESER